MVLQRFRDAYKCFFLGFFILVIACNDDQVPGPSGPTSPPAEQEEEEEPIPPNDSDDERTYSREGFPVGELIAEVYVPSDYDGSQSYPAIYFNDGNLYAEIFFRFTSLDAAPFILIGIDATNPRSERFLPYLDNSISPYTPMAVEYSESIVNELIPAVEERWNVDPNRRAIFGISFGGIHAMWIAIRYPEVFRFSAGLSPSYWVANNAIFSTSVSELIGSGLRASNRFYFDRGTAEWRDILPMIGALEAAELEYGRDIFYYEVVGAGHDFPSWQGRAEVPFRLFMEGASGQVTNFEVKHYCVEEDGVESGRINPLVTYENGVTYSVLSSATYDIKSGQGSIEPDGSYEITSGTSLEVDVTFAGQTLTVTAERCN